MTESALALFWASGTCRSMMLVSRSSAIPGRASTLSRCTASGALTTATASTCTAAAAECICIYRMRSCTCYLSVPCITPQEHQAVLQLYWLQDLGLVRFRDYSRKRPSKVHFSSPCPQHLSRTGEGYPAQEHCVCPHPHAPVASGGARHTPAGEQCPPAAFSASCKNAQGVQVPIGFQKGDGCSQLNNQGSCVFWQIA